MTAAQLPLLAEPQLDPECEAMLRAAFQRSALAKRMTFEDARRHGDTAICIRNIAEILARKHNQGAHP